MKIKDKFILRNVAGEDIAVSSGDKKNQFHGMVTLTGTGTFYWKLLQNDVTEEELLSAVTSEYDIDREQAQKDLTEFLNKLKVAGILDE